MNENTTDEVLLPTNAPGMGDWSGQGHSLDSMSGATLTEEESASSVSATLYFFIAGIILLVLVAAVCVLIISHRIRKNDEQQHKNDEEEATSQYASDSKIERTNNCIAFTIMFIGNFIGLAISIFSITTCQFLDLETPIDLDTPNSSFMNPEYGTIYSLGLWYVSYDSNRVTSGCADTSILPILDWKYKLARASAVLANVFGGICPLLLFILAIKPEFRIHTCYLTWTLLLAVTFQLLTLSLFGSVYCHYEFDGENICEVSLGAAASITASLYWVFGIFACTCLPLYKINLPRS